ncbi:hypothetical protein [uncultured Kordia sp.]|uniref:hypothetical protein n=1 Tax=uncultured Kordia sp. TaxID=507699 RepID=UPI002618783F|nr:hypothetical protein [uncultured Kordia sp.]
MGQRGNYVIKSNEKTTIYYTHWRANYIVNDLILGPEKFIEYAEASEQRTYLTSEPWIESCAYVDIDRKELLFWEVDDLVETSVRQRYLELLSKKWKGWSVSFAEREMYAIEEKMKVNYTEEHDFDFEAGKLENFINEVADEYETTIVMFKKDGKLYTKCSYDLDTEELVFLGEQIVDILDKRTPIDITKRPEVENNVAIAIDCDEKKLIVNYIFVGLVEELSNLWKDWTIEAGNYGYIQILDKAGLDTMELKMKPAEVDACMLRIFNKEDNFDPNSFAKKIIELDENVEFHPSFFENNKPPEE